MNGIELIELDARGLAHPEPLERSLEIMRRLDATKALHLVIHRFPKPLLLIAERHGLAYEACEKREGEWHILIAQKGCCDLKTELERHCRV
ncbi:DUF2249 domain-containing protein [Hydrogenimonas sp.]